MLRLLAAFIFWEIAAHAADDRFVVDDDSFVEKATAAAKALHHEGKLVSFPKLRAHLDRKRCDVQLPAPRAEKLTAREVHRLVRGSTVAVASFYKCAKCNDWHFESASGFVAADGIVSTSEHVVDFEDENMKEGFLVVADSAGAVHAVTEVLAANADSDTCLIRVPGLGLKPLPLNPAAQVGDHLYCLSHPDGNHWMFTEGMLSRFFINRDAATDGGKPPKKEKLKPSLYINVTTEYSPGSSGAPVVDECGNVVGQVQSITTSIEEEEGEKGKNIATSYGMPLRSCVSAEEIAKLAKAQGKNGK